MRQGRQKAIRKLVQAEIDISSKAFRRAATQRLDAARFLLENSKGYLEAIYLAGYAVECCLKALILERTPKARIKDTYKEISTGNQAHDYGYLRTMLRLKQCPIPPEVATSLGVTKLEWSTKLRYVGAIIPHREAKQFVECVELIHRWSERSKP